MLCCWLNSFKALFSNPFFLFTNPFFLFIILTSFIVSSVFRIRRFNWRKLKYRNSVIGIFHPYSNAGGGGERVLWATVACIQKNYPQYEVVIYTGDSNVSSEQIVDNVSKTFKISLKKEPRFVYLKQRRLVEASMYPVFTLLGQSFGSLILGLEALIKETPDIFIDTMGYAFTFPLFKLLAASRIACYVHYPTISSDMLTKVSLNEESFNNHPSVAKSPLLTWIKIFYYNIFAKLYGLVGSFSDLVMVNSSWTRNHILTLWNVPHKTHLLYPPCNFTVFDGLPIERSDQIIRYNIISIAQFRPEKNHLLQISAFRSFLQLIKDEETRKKVKLTLVGSVRNEEDEKRVKALKEASIGLNVEFKLNVSFDELLELVRNSNIGLHTMVNEHFGIGNVELMAGGVVVLAHDSGGPKMDIIQHGLTGFLASCDEYADLLLQITSMEMEELNQIRIRARKHVARFSDETFDQSLTTCLRSIIN